MKKLAPWGRTTAGQKPAGSIRQSQIVTTFGPGAMVDLIDDAVLVGGLDFWNVSKDRGWKLIQEPRLRDAVAERLKTAGRDLSIDAAFREPPAGDDAEPSRINGISAAEFPQWHVCQSPECRALVRNNVLDRKRERYIHVCASRKESACVPVRFAAACKRGHIQDFPWLRFVHEQQKIDRCAGPSLRLLEGVSGDFSEVRVVCSCGASRKLSDATVFEMNPTCLGERPWLGGEAAEPCVERLRLMVRTASNSYFAQVMSALSIPDRAREVADAVQGVWDIVKDVSAETLPTIRKVVAKVEGVLKPFSDEDVLTAIAARKTGKLAAREPLRTAEFRQLVAAPNEVPGELPPKDALFFARAIQREKQLPPLVSRVVVAQKLREVRVQIGFTRIEPASPDLQGEYDLGVQMAALGLTTNWLPATEVRGEGIFLQLDEAAVRVWEESATVIARAKELRAGFDAWVAPLETKPLFPGVRYYLLHSLAHLLSSALSLECGYSASAIRERIYCGPRDAETPMAAIMLSTGSSGSEGTLGGLVEQARQLTSHLRRAFDLAKLCSNDPVCGRHSPEGDQAERFLEGAACHGCLFIAECSCERFNRYLDRALVVPTIGHDASLAFFRERP